MPQMAFRRGRLDRMIGALFGPNSSSTVTVYRAGAQVNGNQSSVNSFTVHPGHRFPFAGGGKLAVARFSGGAWSLVASSLRTVTSSTATTVVFSGSVLTVLDGDYVLNLGSDTGVADPLWTGSPVSLYTNQGGAGSAASQAKASPNTQGEFSFWCQERMLWAVVTSGTTLQEIDLQIAPSEAPAGTRHMDEFATGGTGTSSSPWTGWEDRFTEGFTLRFPAGYYSAATALLQITQTNAPSLTAVIGDGPQESILTITSATGQLKIYGNDSALRVINGFKMQGLGVRAGANNTSAGLVQVQQLDLGSWIGDIWVDPTTSFFVTVGIHILNCENCSFGPLECRGWSSTDAAAGNIRTGIKMETDISETGGAIQRGNLFFSWVHVTNVTTGLSISSTGGGSFDNIFFALFKAVNSGTVVDGTTAVSIAANAEQISFGDVHFEVFNTGLTATGVENIVVHNGLASQIHNVANNAGNAFNIVNGDGGKIFARLATVFNGVVLSGTTTRYFVQQSTAGSVSGASFTDSSSGVNTYLNGQTISTPMIHSGSLKATGGFSIGTAVSVGAIASDTITVPASPTSGVLVTSTEGAVAYDELSTISGGFDGQLIRLSSSSDAQSILVKHGTGNILLGGLGNRLLGNSIDVLALRKLGSNWVEESYQSTRGDQNCNAEEITLATGGLTTDSSANLLPATSIIEAVTAYVTTTITTTTNWALGDSGLGTRFSSASTGLAAGSTVVGLNHRDTSAATPGPVQTAAAKLRITCTGSNPGAGKIRAFVFYKTYRAPAA